MTLLQLTPFHDVLSRWNKQCAIPLNISLIDEMTGGLLPCYLHAILGDSGVGKTWFCLKAINNLFRQRFDAKVLYTDFGGNFRITNLKRSLSNSCQLNRIVIFQPDSLLEQIVFFRNLLEKSEKPYDLIILDSVFGSPLTALEYFQKKAKLWERRIFLHLLDLHHIAREFKIPLLLTNHIIPATENSESNSSVNQYGDHKLEQFVPIEFVIKKNEHKHFIEVWIFKNRIGCSNFDLIP